MAKYRYKALDNSSRKRKGIIDANSKELALDFLLAQNLSPLTLERIKQPESGFWQFQARQKPLSARTASRFAGDLSRMLSAGLPLTQALAFLAENSLDKNSSALAASCVKSVERGAPLSEFLANQGTGIVQELATLVKAGERTGNLIHSLKDAASGFQLTANLREKVRSALVYPFAVIGAVIVTLLIFFVAILPRLRSMFENTEAEMPVSTQILLSVSDFFASYGLFIVTGTVSLMAFATLSERLRKLFRRVFEKITLSPIGFGITQRLIYAGFARRMSTMLAAGVPPTNSVTTAARTISYQSIQISLLEVAESIRKGNPVGISFQNLPHAPPLFINLIEIGVKTSKLPDALRDAAAILEQDASARIEKFIAGLGPSLTVLIGMLVGFVVFSLFTGLTSMYNISL